MRLHILSDLHLEHSPLELPAADSDALVLAGDILSPGHRALAWAARASVNRGRPVLLVPGNHEFYGQTLQAERRRMRDAAARLGVHLLDRGSVVLGGVRFLGCILWTDYNVPIMDAAGYGLHSDPARAMAACAASLADHRVIQWREGRQSEGVWEAEEAEEDRASRLLTPADLLGEHRLDRQWLASRLAEPFGGPTVVITHHAPHALSIAPRYDSDWVTAGFASQLPEKFFQARALWVHGHTHTAFDYRVGACRVVCNPRGYPLRGGRYEVEGFDPAWVVEV